MVTYSINSPITFHTHSPNGVRTASGLVVEVRSASLLVLVDGCNHVVLMSDVVR